MLDPVSIRITITMSISKTVADVVVSIGDGGHERDTTVVRQMMVLVPAEETSDKGQAAADIARGTSAALPTGQWGTTTGKTEMGMCCLSFG
jgi:hypothetical protein